MPEKTIAVDIDDTLNDFTAALQRMEFAYEPAYGLSREVFDGYLERVRAGARDPDPLLSTEFSYFRYRIHQRVYEGSQARADGAQFMRWLRAEGWRIVVCTYRDLRRAHGCTRAWLAANDIPFDHLFMAWNKVVFCRAWGIAHLVDDDPFNIRYGGPHGVQVYYPLGASHREASLHGARGFESFEQVRSWIAS